MPVTNHDYLGYVLAGWGAIVLLGIFLGWNRKIVVFRNYNDLAIVFGMGALAISAFWMMVWWRDSPSMIFLSKVLWFIAAVLLLYVVIRTFIDNRFVPAAVIALITKLSLSILFLYQLVEFLSPSGKTQLQRSKNRSGALIWLTILAPVVYRLVRDQEGVFQPQDVLGRRLTGR